LRPPRSQLCAEHEQEERIELSEAKREFKGKGKGESDRVRALRRVAKITKEHPNCPSRAVVKFLAKGLGDDSFKVRNKSIEFLLEGQHPDETVRVLVAELERARKVLNKLQPAIKASAKLRGKFSKKSTAAFDKIRDLPALTSYTMNLVAALGALPDRRCEDALLKSLKVSFRKAPALIQVATAGSLVQFDSMEALMAVADFQERLASDLKREKIMRRYPVGQQLTVLDAWLGFDRELREEDFDLVAMALVKAVEGKGLKGCPGPGQRDAGEWKAWLVKNKNSYPAQLGLVLEVAQRSKVPSLKPLEEESATGFQR
jgi:hypothetical protein